MHLDIPLQEAIFIKRYKRFFADIIIDGEIKTAHCPNTGSLRSCLHENMPCLYTFHDDPKRKLAYTLEAVKPGASWVGIQTHRANEIVEELILKNPILDYSKYRFQAREVKINDKSRTDFCLWMNDIGSEKPRPEEFKKAKFHFVEVKNVTYMENEVAYFPDAVTDRGLKHIHDLMELKAQGHSAEFLFLIQRSDCKSFAPAEHIDTKYTKALKEAYKDGLGVSTYVIDVSPKGYSLKTHPIKLIL